MQHELQIEQLAYFDGIEDSMTGISAQLAAIANYQAEQKGWLDQQIATGQIFVDNLATTRDHVADIAKATIELTGSSFGLAVASGLAQAGVNGLNSAAGSLIGLVQQLGSALAAASSQQANVAQYTIDYAQQINDYNSSGIQPLLPNGASDWRSRVTQFAEGGYTGDGPKYKAKGIVHANEYVVPEDGALVRYNKEDSENLRELVRLMRILADKETSFSAIINGVPGEDKVSFFDKSRARL
jgi:hypothetical protein